MSGSPTTSALPRVALCLPLLAALACTSQAKKDLLAFEAAQRDYDAARKALRECDLTPAHDHLGQATDALVKLRRSRGRAFDENTGPGPVVAGKTAQAWQEGWERDFQQAVEQQLPELLARTARGELDWSRGRAFLTTYRPDLDAQWVAAVDSAAGGQLARLGQTYFFECESPAAEDVCQAVASALPGQLARPLTKEGTLTTGVREQAFGFVRVKVEYDRDHRYANLQDPQRGTNYSLPARARLQLTVVTKAPGSSWDGAVVYTVEREPPVTVSTDDLEGTRTRHDEAMTAALLAQLKARPAQTLNP